MSFVNGKVHLVQTRLSYVHPVFSSSRLRRRAVGVGVPSASASFLPETEPGSIEDALLQLIQEHHTSSLKLRERTDRAKKDAIKKAARAAELMVEAVNGGVQESFVNEKRIEHEIRALVATITRFTKQTDQWLTVTNSINTVIKEIGDFENWMKIMEFDCKSITAAIHNIHQA